INQSPHSQYNNQKPRKCTTTHSLSTSLAPLFLCDQTLFSSMAPSIDDFLKQCEQSGDSAYSALRSLLDRLEDPATRTQSRIFLTDLYKRVGNSDQCLHQYHFRIQDVVLEHDADQGRKKLKMMVIPSIFLPEDWSFTFYEGLNRHPDSIFKDRTVAELGCGNGWISIALADKWLPSKVYGLDINPRAIKVSWINLYLNALDDEGQPIYDAEKKTLLDRVEFYESDLLSYCRDKDIQLERIIGCIPQILNPNPDAMSKLITENASEDFLYDLSNYCALQGFVEDQFGLGLIARAVEEGIDVIKPLGIMIFNMGGRPGQAVCKRLFERRGFHINKLWQTKVVQASDTDITALVEIEKNSPHRFEFFMGLTADQPICARTAWAYGKAGGRIAHALSVYSCQLRQPQQVKKIFKFLRNGFHDVGSSLDLSFEDDAVADEKIPFLAYLAGELKENSSFPYEPPAGSMQFRNLIAGFMKTYHHIPLKSNVLESVKKPWVCICGPTTNPAGLIYSNKEMDSILTSCAKFGAKVIIDTSFSGLEFDEGWGGWNLGSILSKLTSSNPSFCVSLLGGMSLKMFTGALRFGFLILNNPDLVDAFHGFPGLSKPHVTMRYAVKKILGLNEQKEGEITKAVAENTKTLKCRAQRLKEVNYISMIQQMD
ncbi:Methionine S-methyltransferase, partial [Linum perenne]